jgi:hypothetical protein
MEAAMLGVLGAVLAAIAYELAGIWLFPTAQTDRPLPLSSESRLFAYLVVTLITAAVLAFGVSRRKYSSGKAESLPA